MNLSRRYYFIVLLLLTESCVTLVGCKKKSHSVTTTIHGHIKTQEPYVIASNLVIQLFYNKNTLLGLTKSKQLKDSILSDYKGDYHLSFTTQSNTEEDVLSSEFYSFNLKKDPLIQNQQSNSFQYYLGKDNEIDLSVIIYQAFKARFTIKSKPNGYIRVDTQQGSLGLSLSKTDSLANITIPKGQKTILIYSVVSPSGTYHTLKQRDTIDLIASPLLQNKNFVIDNEGF